MKSGLLVKKLLSVKSTDCKKSQCFFCHFHVLGLLLRVKMEKNWWVKLGHFSLWSIGSTKAHDKRSKYSINVIIALQTL
jgi:hypothetical protein